MPRNNNRVRKTRRINTRNRVRNRGLLTYAPPIFRPLSMPTTDIMLTYGFRVTAPVSGATGYNFPIPWHNFDDVTGLLSLFRYMEVRSWRVELQYPGSENNSQGAAIAFLPIDYNIEGPLPSTVLPTNSGQILQYPGSVFMQPGTNNKGKWFANEAKQVYSVGDAFLTANARIAGNMMAFLDSGGTWSSDCCLFCNVRLYGREFLSEFPTFTTARQLKDEPLISEKLKLVKQSDSTDMICAGE